ncbi:uncharacterized protein LOC127813529 [Diospyros lotus]|uniref:uncharacterized protein LOC127813529 n=1 Tax=Diospyros lotus TaxID=55363 RepID=UPI002257FFC5|nr:uncharacterized protein LOC127813529 [Diospyros lotus]
MMKSSQKDSESRALPKFMVGLIVFVSATYVIYTLKLVTSPAGRCDDDPLFTATTVSANRLSNATELPPAIEANDSEWSVPGYERTELRHVAFGIAGSARLWENRKNYIKLWWKPAEMRGVVWLDSPLNESEAGDDLPHVKISGNTDQFSYSNQQGLKLAIRISRIVSETFRLGLRNVRWFVMGDDDTFFVTQNLLTVLNKYDHNGYYYIGGNSESHLQNIYFSSSMAFGGGGFAISYPLAKAIEKFQDRCIQRYPGLFASDDRMQACMAELGVPLTREPGFHQFDVFGNLFGILAAHPVAPLVSMHHLDVVEPIFPNSTRVAALQRLQIPMGLDPSAIVQQSICYDKEKKWTVSVSWGFAVQIIRGVLSPREVEMPARTFLNWYKKADFMAYSFNTRPVARNPCQNPFIFYMSKARLDSLTNRTLTEYSKHRVPHLVCKWEMPDPADIDTVVVYKTPDPRLWDRAPRRNCCRMMESVRRGLLVLDVGLCMEGEVCEI